MIEIIAECGVNHNGDVELAKEMISAAKEAGANTVKFQLFNVEELVRPQTPLASYQKETFDLVQNQKDLLNKLSLTPEQHLELISECQKSDIQYLTSIFDMQSLNSVTKLLDQKRVKLGSGELTNYQLIKGVIDQKLSVILSTGMTSLSELTEVLKFISYSIENPSVIPTTTRLADYQTNEVLLSERVSVLHCTSQYPTPPKNLNLNNIKTLRDVFKGHIGLSDHSEGILAAVTGVGIGINILEKHFTLSRNMVGPDHKASMEPTKFVEMVQAVREAEVSLGTHTKQVLKIEENTANVAKKSLCANQKIYKGEKFTVDNLTVKRPGTGVSSRYFFDYIGKISHKDYENDDFIL